MDPETGRVWTCKIGGTVNDLPNGADGPMRQAIKEAYRLLTGEEPKFCFSGWGGELDKGEKEVVKKWEAKGEKE